MTALQLGQRVTITHELVRVEGRTPVEGNIRRWTKLWTPQRVEREGIIVGKRTLQQGYSYYLGQDEGTGWAHTGTLEAYLIAFEMRRKPVPALLEHITPTLPPLIAAGGWRIPAFDLDEMP